jgi:hypothetical protein
VAVLLEGGADRRPVVVGHVVAQVLGAVDDDALGDEAVPHGAEVERLAVHEHPVEVEDHRAQ